MHYFDWEKLRTEFNKTGYANYDVARFVMPNTWQYPLSNWTPQHIVLFLDLNDRINKLSDRLKELEDKLP